MDLVDSVNGYLEESRHTVTLACWGLLLPCLGRIAVLPSLLW